MKKKLIVLFFLALAGLTNAQKNSKQNNQIFNLSCCCSYVISNNANFSSFSGYSGDVCPGCPFQLAASCSQVLNWNWYWGDGTNSTNVNNGITLTHQYNTPGVYVVTLTPNYVSSPQPTGCLLCVYAITITVSYSNCATSCCPNFNFAGTGFSTFSTTTNAQVYNAGICPGYQFTVNASACPAVNSFLWDFGDGSPTVSGFNAIHQYNIGGTYTIVGTAMGVCCINTQSIVVIAGSPYCPPCCQGFYLGNNGFQTFMPNGPNIYNAVICPNTQFSVNLSGCSVSNTYTWNFGDATPLSNISNPSHQYSAVGNYTITVSGSGPGCSVPAQSICVNVTNSPIIIPPLVCTSLILSLNACYITNGLTYTWNFGDGTFGSGTNVNHTYNSPGNYLVTVTPSTGSPVNQNVTVVTCQPPPCINCIGSFAPDAGDYILSIWVKEDISPQPLTYNNAQVQLTFINDPTVYTFGTNILKNKIIDGWQRIEEPFTIPPFATHLNIRLVNTGVNGSQDAFFDDIRIFPKNGQMKTYVYDPIMLRLSAILDENNYATFYEYDEEGKLIRIKRETEKGIMTINENTEGLKKQ